MNPTIEYLIERFRPDTSKKLPWELHNINRTIMAQTLKDLGFTTGAEVGVAQGIHARILCEQIPGVKLYAIDVWDHYKGYREYTSKIHGYYNEARERLKSFDNAVMIKKFSMEAVKDFEDGSLDFVFIDGAHDFKNVAMDVSEWIKKVRLGGILYGHDYKRSIPTRSRYINDVKDVVQAFAYAKHIVPWFAITCDIPDPIIGRDNPCWMFVRQESDYL